MSFHPQAAAQLTSVRTTKMTSPITSYSVTIGFGAAAIYIVMMAEESSSMRVVWKCLVLGGILVYASGIMSVSWYRISTALDGIKRLYYMPQEEKNKAICAYEFLQKMQAGDETRTEDETAAIRAYYNVLNELLAVADIEKLYIPPQLSEFEGLYANQLLLEQDVFTGLNLKKNAQERPYIILDMGCGRGRVAHYFAKTLMGGPSGGGKVSGYNIDPNQIENAIEYAAKEGMSDVLDFQVGDHHHLADLKYDDESFDGCYSIQATWPFFKKNELAEFAQEMYRILRKGARYSCSEYTLTPHFDWNNEEHVRLHKLYLPTLAATHSMYPADICDALENAGFKIILSAPSKSVAWPLCEQKRNLFYGARRVIRALTFVKLCPEWVEHFCENLQKGGQAWTDAEKMKIADLNWRIVCEK